MHIRTAAHQDARLSNMLHQGVFVASQALTGRLYIRNLSVLQKCVVRCSVLPQAAYALCNLDQRILWLG